jgi:hypothetical protein
MFAQMSPFFPTQHHDDRHFTVIASVQYGVHRDEYRAGVHNHAFTSKLREHRAVAQQQQATERHVEWCASTKKRRILRQRLQGHVLHKGGIHTPFNLFVFQILYYGTHSGRERRMTSSAF